ncbi:hypothetical protein HZY93_01800 [Streptococcus danieliae]|uniref:Holin-like toxin n=1 Tax=Streptococcus danieliae TaxID=747656 RepID=A0A7Z0LC56_9STRE|nr:hypothetical protein [Streptococcus danieliae]NYS48717.1 hypothetical protein [Streptococcus danieliae]
MSVEAAIGLMLQFGIFLLTLLTFIVLCIHRAKFQVEVSHH